MNSEDGAQNRKRPKPMWRPGTVEEPESLEADGKTFGTKGLTTADVDEYLARIRGGDDVSQSKKSASRSSTSSRRRVASKRTSKKSSARSPTSPRNKATPPDAPSEGTSPDK